LARIQHPSPQKGAFFNLRRDDEISGKAQRWQQKAFSPENAMTMDQGEGVLIHRWRECNLQKPIPMADSLLNPPAPICQNLKKPWKSGHGSACPDRGQFL
jgi:hypothetical protein